jgi:beta-lactam-binding protein with PASTA domain
VLAEALGQVTVPPIVGNTATDAQTKLESAGFDVATQEVESDEPAVVVIAADPPEGTEVEPGTTITISVSLGPSGDGGAGLGDDDDESGGAGGAQPPPPTP